MSTAQTLDYDTVRAGFSWEVARQGLAGLPGGRGLNIAHEAVDRHVLEGHGSRVALRCLGTKGQVEDVTYDDLRRSTNRFAHVLRGLGLGKGDRVMSLLGRTPDQYVAALGTLKNTSVFSPLFSSFGPEPIKERMRLSGATVLVTTPELYRRKVLPMRPDLEHLQQVLLVGGSPAAAELAGPGVVDLAAAMAEADDRFEIPPTDPGDMALLHFTSGTTGKPKGAVHVHEAVVAHRATSGFALDLRPEDVFWCTADPGWVTGTSYGIIAPLTQGATLITYAGDFDARAWYDVLARHRVTVWYTAPTALRMLVKHGSDLAHEYDLSALRHIASVGEALNPEVVEWGREAYGMPIHDNWWQTETGAIMISNYRFMDIRPGSMGRPMPGIDAAVLRQGADGRAAVVDGHVTPAAVGEVGELAVRKGWPSMFRGYLDAEERYRKLLRRRVVPQRRPREGRRGRLLLVRRPRRRRHQVRGPPDRPVRGRDRADGAPGGRRGRGDRQAGSGGRRARQGVRHRAPRGRADRRAAEGAARLRTTPPRWPGPQGDRLRPAPAAHQQRQGDAPAAQGPRARPRHRRHLHPGAAGAVVRGAVVMTTDPARAPDRLALLRTMLTIRRFEEACAELYSATKIRGFLHLYVGEEAVATGVMAALGPEDGVVTTYREHGHALARGVSMNSIMAEMFGKVTGCSRGRGGSMHLFDAATRFVGGNAIVGGGLPLSIGMALADRMRGLDRVTVCFFGDGAVAEGEFHETLNLAALWHLPVLFCCENNLYAMGTSIHTEHANTELAMRASSYGITAWPVDGMDVLAVAESAHRAVEEVRGGAGPHFLELRTFRYRAHSMYDSDRYREKSEIEAWKQHDPIETLGALLRAEGQLDDEKLQQLEQDVAAQIAEAVATADEAPFEPVDDLTRFVVSDPAGASR